MGRVKKVSQTNDCPIKVANKKYKPFEELSDEEINDLIFYECFVADVMDKYINTFTEADVKKKYAGCTFPHFMLQMIHHIHKKEKLKSDFL